MLFATLFAALAAISPASALLDKPAMNPPLPGGLNVFSGPLVQHLPSMGQHNDKWGAGWLPARCKEEAVRQNINPNDIEAFNVYYNDCGSSWVMCRHKNAELSLSKAIDLFGRMPVRMRDYVQHLILLPGQGSTHAASYGNTITFWGDLSFTVFVHETAHSLDSHAFEWKPFHASQLWLSEYAKDSAVPDDYARSSQAENVAQNVVIALADKTIPGGIGTITPAWNQIFHQYATMQWKLGDKLFQGGTCNRKWQNSAPVSTYSKRSRMGPAPRYLVEGEHDFITRDENAPVEAIMSWYDENGNVYKSEVVTY